MLKEKRPFTGLHGKYKSPQQLREWLSKFDTAQVQINDPQGIYRGEISRYSIEDCGKTGYIEVVFEYLYIGDHPAKIDQPIIWSEYNRPSCYTGKRKMDKSDGFKWVYSNNQKHDLFEPVKMRMLYSAYYMTRECRIKLKGVAEHWRFFGKKDPTNLLRTEGGTITQKTTII